MIGLQLFGAKQYIWANGAAQNDKPMIKNIIISQLTGLYEATRDGRERFLLAEMRQWLYGKIDGSRQGVWFDDYGQHGEWVLTADEETITAFLLKFRK